MKQPKAEKETQPPEAEYQQERTSRFPATGRKEIDFAHFAERARVSIQAKGKKRSETKTTKRKRKRSVGRPKAARALATAPKKKEEKEKKGFEWEAFGVKKREQQNANSRLQTQGLLAQLESEILCYDSLFERCSTRRLSFCTVSKLQRVLEVSCSRVTSQSRKRPILLLDKVQNKTWSFNNFRTDLRLVSLSFTSFLFPVVSTTTLKKQHG